MCYFPRDARQPQGRAGSALERQTRHCSAAPRGAGRGRARVVVARGKRIHPQGNKVKKKKKKDQKKTHLGIKIKQEKHFLVILLCWETISGCQLCKPTLPPSLLSLLSLQGMCLGHQQKQDQTHFGPAAIFNFWNLYVMYKTRQNPKVQ